MERKKGKRKRKRRKKSSFGHGHRPRPNTRIGVASVRKMCQAAEGVGAARHDRFGVIYLAGRRGARVWVVVEPSEGGVSCAQGGKQTKTKKKRQPAEQDRKQLMPRRRRAMPGATAVYRPATDLGRPERDGPGASRRDRGFPGQTPFARQLTFSPVAGPRFDAIYNCRLGWCGFSSGSKT